MMNRLYKTIILTMLCLSGLSIQAAKQCSLQSVPFCSWNGWGTDARSTGTADCNWVIGESTDLPYGDVFVINYADLSAFSSLIVKVSEGTPRMLFNRDVDEGQWDEVESQSHLIDNTRVGWSDRYFSVDGNTYTVDLARMKAEKGYAHLHAIKGGDWVNVTVTEMVLVSPDNTIDMTSSITNPDFEDGPDAGSAQGWTIDRTYDGGNVQSGPYGEGYDQKMIEAIGKTNHCFESWRCHDFDVWQELTDLPAGVYSLSLQGYVRCEIEGYTWGEDFLPDHPSPFYVYMNDATAKFPNVFSQSLEELGHTLTYIEDWTVSSVNDKQYPNSIGAAAQCFGWGMYKVELIAVVNPGETVRIGVKGKTDEDWWCAWDNFQLTYLGDSSPDGSTERLVNGNFEGDDVTCFMVRNGDGVDETSDDHPAEIQNGIGFEGSRGVCVHAVDNPPNEWDAQFFIYTPNFVWKAGQHYCFSFKARADKLARISVQSHTTPSNYIFWDFAGGGYDITTDWKSFEYEGVVTEEQTEDRDLQTIAFNLSVLAEANTYYFDDISWKTISEGGEPGPVTDLPEGNYYLKNVETGKYWGAANDSGTRASLVKNPEYITLHKQPDGKYMIETQYVDGSSENCYFNGEYMDHGPGEASLLTIAKIDDGTYTIANGDNYFGYDGTSTVLGKDLGKGNSNARWQILNEAEMQATLNGASAENPIDATFYIKDPNFSRNHRYADAWTMEAENQDLCGGEDNNRCAESWHSVFTLRQQIKNVPNGYYGLIAQGFYRQDGEDNDNLPYFYINDQHTQFLVKGGLPDHDGSGWESMGDVSVEFSNGAYTISPIYVQVTDGTITLGARLENNTELWAIWDNFELYYYGDSKPFNDKTFVYNKIKYHTTSDETVEVVGRDGNLSSTVTIPAKVTNDGNSYTVTAIKAHAFGWIGGITSITIPSSILYIEDQAIVCCGDLKSINVNANNPNYCSVEGVLFTKDMKRLVSYPPGKDAVYYAIPEGVEILGTSCLRDCQKLESITIPSSFKEIWWWPLEGSTNLTNVICMMEKPFMEEYGEYMFDPQIYEKATLWVPQGCLANYQSRSPWNKFKAIKTIPSQITVTAKSYEIEYGDDLPTLEYSATSGPLVGQPKITCSATKKSKAGTYDIIIEQGTLSSASTLRFVNGKLTVKKAPLTVSVSNYTKKQGDPMPTFTITYSGFKNGENENSLTKKPTISCSANESTGPGSYAIVVSGAESPNYTFTYKSATLTVTKADAVIITAKSYTITYGDALPTFEYTVSGGELKGTPSITCSASSRPSAGVYDIIVSKGSVSNYNVSYVKGTLTVTKAPLTVSVDNYSRKEGEANPTFNISYSGFKWNDTVNSLIKKATASCNATATSAPGLYNISVSGAESPNYSFTYKNGTLTVIAIDAIAVKGKNYTITYGESVPNFEYTVEGGTLQGKPSITCSAGSHPAAGIYDIVVSKGSVTNYKVSYVNGTLTVKKAPLTVSVENCTKYKGEANPSFNIKYNGFKWSDNVNSLTKKPTASCEANEWSPAGTYPITLSGAESGNYDFSYVNGTLTVKDVFNMAITPIGNGVVKYNGNTISNYSQFEVKEGENVKLTFVPGNGYQLESFMLNGEDATKSVDNNAYTINNISKDINIVVTFGESQGNFKEGDVRYAILSAPAKTVVVEKSNTYRGHIVIPVSVRHDGTDWNVVGVEDNAFNNCTSLISVELPRSLEFGNVGTSLFVGCTSLAAIIWNPDYAMTSTMLGVVDNPNLLFYAGSSSYVPSGIANAVINEKAKSITLQDVASGNGNFYCPKPFTASTISYTHNYTMESAINGVQGWETLALPFDVQKIEHSREGALIPFIKYHRDNTNERPFWLYTYGSSGFERSGVIAANRAYIICMPNNAEYDSEYRLNGQVTFSSQNVRVESSSWKYTQKKGDKELCPAFCLQKKSADVYALNVSNDLHGETGNRAPGSAFISDLRAVSPFEAYMTTTSGSSRMVIDIEFDDATGIGFPSDSDIRSSRQRIYSLTGQLVFQGDNREEFQKVLRKLPAGVYIINGRKQQIK